MQRDGRIGFARRSSERGLADKRLQAQYKVSYNMAPEKDDLMPARVWCRSHEGRGFTTWSV